MNEPVKITEHMTLRFRGNEINCVTPHAFTMKKVKDEKEDDVLYCHKNGEFLLFNMDDFKPYEVPGHDVIVSADSKLVASCSKDEVTMTIRDVKTMTAVRRCKLRRVNFWQWISPSVIGLVSEAAVFHWSVEKERPVKMFTLERGFCLTVTDYVCDVSGRFLAVSSLNISPHRLDTQLYDVETKTSRVFNGMAPAFVTIETKTFLCFVSPDDDLVKQNMSSSILSIVECAASASSSELIEVKFVMNPNVTSRGTGGTGGTGGGLAAVVSMFGFDNVIGSAASNATGIVFVLSALGNVVAFDVATARCVYRKCLFEGLELEVSDFYRTGAYHKGNDEGIIGATRNGKIISVAVDREGGQILLKTPIVEDAASQETITKKKKKNKCGSKKKKEKAGANPTPESLNPPIHNLTLADEAATVMGNANADLAQMVEGNKHKGDKHEEVEEDEGKLCIVCYENPCNAVFVPCGHMWFCYTCADEIKQKEGSCPACRATVTSAMKVFTLDG